MTVLVCGAGGCLSAAAPAAAATQCTGTLSGTVTGSVVVPGGSACTLAGATINGSVSVGGGSETKLRALAGTRIAGALTASGSGGVEVNDSSVGSISISGVTPEGSVAVCGTSVKASVTVKNTTARIYIGDETRETDAEDACQGGPDNIGGSVVFTGNATDVLQLAGSTVKGSVTVANNGPGPEEGEEDLANNTIGGSFTCRGNAVAEDGSGGGLGSLFDIFGTTAVGALNCAAPTDLS